MLVKFKYNNFNIKLVAENFTASEEDKIRQAAYYMVYALGHDDFKKFCLKYEYKVKTCYWSGFKRKCYYKKYKTFYKSGGRTNYQVYKHLMSGEEELNEEIDNEADVFLRIDRRYKPGVVGYTYPSSKWQYLYMWVVEERNAEYIAGNLAHEWCHKLGYSHNKNSNPHRKHTVTYAVGNYVRDFLYKRYRDEKEKEKIRK